MLLQIKIESLFLLTTVYGFTDSITMSGDYCQRSKIKMSLNGKIITITGYLQIDNETQEQSKIKLQSYFERYGPLRQINIFSGFGNIEYLDSRDAEDAYNNTNIHQLFLVKEITYTVLIKGFSTHCDKKNTEIDKLMEIFGRYGHIESIDVGQKHCMIKYSDYRDAQDAIESLNKTIIDGQKIRVLIF